MKVNIVDDQLNGTGGPQFVSLGEVMIRDTPADLERPERTRQIYISTAGSEYSVTIGVSRLGLPAAFVTRVPENPYGYMVRNIARENGVDTSHFVWAPRTEPIGRYIYEIGRTPRQSVGIYQRMGSAASKLSPGSVQWRDVLKDAKAFHVSGITFGLASHSGYETNHLLETFKEGASAAPASCLVGLDFNYRGTLWSRDEVRGTLTSVIKEHVDLLITTAEDMAAFFDIPCGSISPERLLSGSVIEISDADLKQCMETVIDTFGLKVVALSRRYIDSLENQRFESVALTSEGGFTRSAAPRGFVVQDRLGGGDAWGAGFYYGLLTSKTLQEGIAKGVIVGDAAIAFQQTLMFDLPILSRSDLQPLIDSPLPARGVSR